MDKQPMNAETMTDKPAPCPVAELSAMLSPDRYETGIVFNHSPHEIGLHVTENYEVVAEALAAWNARTVQAELVEALAKVMPIRVHNGSDYAEVYFSDGTAHSTQAMTMNPQDWQDIADAYAAITQAEGPQANG